MAEHQPIMNPTPDNPDWAGLAQAPADVCVAGGAGRRRTRRR